MPAARPIPPPTQCGTTPDGHLHYLGDTDGGTALVCCHDSEPTYPLAYQEGRVQRYRDKPDVEQVRTRQALNTAATTHKAAAHPGTIVAGVRDAQSVPVRPDSPSGAASHPVS